MKQGQFVPKGPFQRIEHWAGLIKEDALTREDAQAEI